MNGSARSARAEIEGWNWSDRWVDDTLLCGQRGSPGRVTVADYRMGETDSDHGWSKKPDFIRRRLFERYIAPVRALHLHPGLASSIERISTSECAAGFPIKGRRPAVGGSYDRARCSTARARLMRSNSRTGFRIPPRPETFDYNFGSFTFANLCLIGVELRMSTEPACVQTQTGRPPCSGFYYFGAFQRNRLHFIMNCGVCRGTHSMLWCQ